MARGRPNWWVILAVSLALMALLVATSGSTPDRVGRGHTPTAAVGPGHSSGPAHSADGSSPAGKRATTTTTTTTTTAGAPPPTSVPSTSGTTLFSSHAVGAGPTTTAPSVTTTTTGATTTTTTAAPASQPADRMQAQGYLSPPLQTSNVYGFTGTGAMQISVLWSGSTYLTMTVGCPSGGQSVGGTSAMAASLPDASGSCRATVSEPSSESAALTYTITIGPAGG